MRTIASMIVAVLALTVMAPGHAEEVTINHWANLRLTQDINSKKIAKIKPDTQVEMVTEGEQFDQIIYKDKIGWIRKEYVVRPEPAPTTVDIETRQEVPGQTFITKVDPERQPNIFDKLVTQTRDSLDSFVRDISTPWITFKVTPKDVDCLAQNIYYEAQGEPEEGKVAVAMVTINRVRSGEFGKTICDVVRQRTTFVKSTVIKEDIVQRGSFGGVTHTTQNRLVLSYVPVCQFSWVCAFIRRPQITNPTWVESQRIAQAVIDGEYDEWGNKYSQAIYFHSSGLRPDWSYRKRFIGRVGGHLFYGESKI